jgi:acyl carrier protein
MEEKIKQLIEDKLGISPGDYRNDERFIDDLGCDSLDMVDLIMECEKEFNISIPDDDVYKILTVQDLIDYVTERCK